MANIDIDNQDFYEFGVSEEKKQQTRQRLQQMIDMGLTEVGVASFGVKGVVSGLYIEMVWNKNEEDWKDYIDWMQSVIDKKK